MIRITDSEEIIEFMKVIDDINQELKTVYGVKSWINRNGRCVCCIDGQLPSLVELYYYNKGFTKKREPIIEKVLEYINQSTFMIIPTEFFAFNKEFKKVVEEIIIDENSIQFKTITTCLVMEFNKKLIKKEHIITGEEISTIEGEDDLVEKILAYENSIFKMVLCLENEKILLDPDTIEDDSYISIKLNKKFISGLRNKYKTLKTGTKPDDVSKIYITLFDTEEESKYIIRITCDNKNTKVSSYYGVTDY